MRRVSRSLALPVALAAVAIASLAVAGDHPEHPKPAPGLKAGAAAPTSTLKTVDDQPVDFASLYKNGPVVVIFYRGGWCPYCTKSLQGWDEKMDEIKAMNATVVAITPEKPQFTKETAAKQAAHMTVLSDAGGELANKFGLLFSLDEVTKKKYQGYGIDLSERNADAQWNLPHPGTFIIDTKGVVRFASVNPDYTVRPSPDEILPELRKIAGN